MSDCIDLLDMFIWCYFDVSIVEVNICCKICGRCLVFIYMKVFFDGSFLINLRQEKELFRIIFFYVMVIYLYYESWFFFEIV